MVELDHRWEQSDRRRSAVVDCGGILRAGWNEKPTIRWKQDSGRARGGPDDCLRFRIKTEGDPCSFSSDTLDWTISSVKQNLISLVSCRGGVFFSF